MDEKDKITQNITTEIETLHRELKTSERLLSSMEMKLEKKDDEVKKAENRSMLIVSTSKENWKRSQDEVNRYVELHDNVKVNNTCQFCFDFLMKEEMSQVIKKEKRYQIQIKKLKIRRDWDRCRDLCNKLIDVALDT